MKESRKQSPFAAENRQERLDQWICRQHQQQELSETKLEPDEMDEVRNAPPAQMHTAVNGREMIPGHRQYDAIVSKLQSARKLAGKDQSWSG